ncbi:CheY-like chemotaxis protein [Methanofollis sp. W23]|uniref:response regulator n=1 Tax=Methanofollis sp. W23 TaxID=2817849 RepID=UPI001AEB8F09|nr:response regulator [Methanofollis sp. W23]MBP2146783.1 CheY-like chemotaxis protein [Methanofollis sp. W23]
MIRNERLQVLLVDDDPEVLERTKEWFEGKEAFFCTTAPSAIVALDLLPAGKFDAVVSDCQMPGMDGVTFFKTLRAQGFQVPGVLYTGMGRDSVLEDALAAGASFYVRKGVGTRAELVELAHAVRAAVALASLR